MLSGTNLTVTTKKIQTKKHLLVNLVISRGRLNLTKQDTKLSGTNVTFSFTQISHSTLA